MGRGRGWGLGGGGGGGGGAGRWMEEEREHCLKQSVGCRIVSMVVCMVRRVEIQGIFLR